MFATCCRTNFARISRAAASAAKDRLRRMGLLGDHAGWKDRALLCERCPMRFVHRNITYCGRPFLSLPVRNEAVDGCGCPTIAKARDHDEHCPITPQMRPSIRSPGTCDCKWCSIARTAVG
ncbi:MAG TPA: hypothetical protein PLD59_07115 [Tepidisphaeraceae bacterium]|nr:hypothetical protein [Tepidisphaeraceae bacterium]